MAHRLTAKQLRYLWAAGIFSGGAAAGALGARIAHEQHIHDQQKALAIGGAAAIGAGTTAYNAGGQLLGRVKTKSELFAYHRRQYMAGPLTHETATRRSHRLLKAARILTKGSTKGHLLRNVGMATAGIGALAAGPHILRRMEMFRGGNNNNQSPLRLPKVPA